LNPLAYLSFGFKPISFARLLQLPAMHNTNRLLTNQWKFAGLGFCRHFGAAAIVSINIPHTLVACGYSSALANRPNHKSWSSLSASDGVWVALPPHLWPHLCSISRRRHSMWAHIYGHLDVRLRPGSTERLRGVDASRSFLQYNIVSHRTGIGPFWQASCCHRTSRTIRHGSLLLASSSFFLTPHSCTAHHNPVCGPRAARESSRKRYLIRLPADAWSPPAATVPVSKGLVMEDRK